MSGRIRSFRPTRNFTSISNGFLRLPQDKISTSAFRVALFLLSHNSTYRTSQASIARQLGLGGTTVSVALKELEEGGYLERVPTRNGNRRGADDYVISSQVLEPSDSEPTDFEPSESEALEEDQFHKKIKTEEEDHSSSSADDGSPEPAAAAPKPKTAAALEAEFEAWWMHYPRKVGKGSALRAFKTARKTVSVTELHDGLGAAIRAWGAARTETQYKPHPATWLNRQGWLDDPAAVASAQTSPNRRTVPGPGVVHTQEEIRAQREWLAQQPAATPISAEELAEFWGEELGEPRD